MAVPGNRVDQLIEQVKNNIGRAGDSTVDDYAIEWINQAQTKICNRANFWFMRKEDTSTLALTQGDLSKALPSDFKNEDIISIKTSDGDFIPLEAFDYEDYRKQWDDTTQAQPTHYVLDGAGNVLFRPVPDDSYNITMDYWAYLTDLVAAGSSNNLLDNYPDILEAGATWRGMRTFGEIEDATYWKGVFETELKDLLAANADRELPDEMQIQPRPDVFGKTTSRIKGRIG